MNYMDLLTSEEKSILCELITGKEFRELFKKNEKAFHKIQKGFSAKKLKDNLALSIAKANVDDPFIKTWVNILVDHWLHEMEDAIKKFEENGSSHSAAVATTLVDSHFANNIDLYFKLLEKPLTADACSILYERMEDIKTERVKQDENIEFIKGIKKENQRLSEQIEEIQRNMDAVKVECEKHIQEVEHSKTELTSMLEAAQAKITELETTPNSFSFVRDDARYLSQLDDTNESILPPEDTNNIWSLCSIISTHKGPMLMRHADLNSDGRYTIFHQNKDIPPYFKNRDKIFFNDGPSNNILFGIWTWTSEPANNDPTKDYVLSWYHSELDAIEIILIPEVTTIDDLITLLKKGVDDQLHSRKTLFAFRMSDDRYTGVLCTEKELDTSKGKTTFSEDCIEVPVYEFTSKDIMRLNNGLSFYHNAFAGMPKKLYKLKSPLEITKDIVLSSLSWSAYKLRGGVRSEYSAFRKFLEKLPVDDITSKIAITCRCSIPAAKDLLDEFLDTVWKFVDGNTLEDEIISSAISTNKDLQEKAITLVRKDWEIKNKGFLEAAQKQLDTLNTELRSTADSLIEAEDSLKKVRSEEKRLSESIAEKEKLAKDVEKAVAARIQSARENAADFIASMAFIGESQPVKIPDPVEALSELEADPYHIQPACDDLGTLKAHHSWTDVIDTTEDELEESGVAKKYSRGLATFLCAAYIKKQPLLLVGPNVNDIVQAFCAAVSAHKCGVLYCEGDYSCQMIKNIGAAGENIVIVNNLLASGWMNRLPEILSKKDIFYIITHPYAEDIQVEPKSLFNFALPLFTEFFIDEAATGEYIGGYFADDFKAYAPSENDAENEKKPIKLPKLSWSLLVRNQIKDLINIMHDINSITTIDEDFLFSIFPIAYASLAIDELTEAIADSKQGLAISSDLKRALEYVLGEL